MNKKNEHPEQAPISSHTKGLSMKTDYSAKQPPKKHRAMVQILKSSTRGITENEILFTCRLSSGRNYISELERELSITFIRHKEENPDGIGAHFRYRFLCREDVLKVIAHVNKKAELGRYNGLSEFDINQILSLYPEQEAA